MNDSFGGGFSGTQAGETQKQETRSEGILPVFIKQIHAQKEDLIKLWGFDFKMINTVAIVREIEHSSTKITYTLSDITGRINAHLWVEEGDAPADAGIMLNTYARVIGAVRQQGDVKSIMIYNIRAVKNINEVNTHYLEVINARYQTEEYYRMEKGGEMGQATVKTEIIKEISQSTTASNDNGPSGKARILFNAIRPQDQTQSESGIHRAELKKRFTQFSSAEIDHLLEQMAADGHIYSTIDTDHFMACF